MMQEHRGYDLPPKLKERVSRLMESHGDTLREAIRFFNELQFERFKGTGHNDDFGRRSIHATMLGASEFCSFLELAALDKEQTTYRDSPVTSEPLKPWSMPLSTHLSS